MNIYERLKQDHDRQRELMAQIMETSGDTPQRRDLWQSFRLEAEAHANAEEQTFYATLIAEPDTQEKARHSVHEHEEAAELIEELCELDLGSGGWINKFEKLKRELEHHVEEEEKEVFVKAREVIDDDQARRLASEFDQRKRSELAELRAA